MNFSCSLNFILIFFYEVYFIYESFSIRTQYIPHYRVYIRYRDSDSSNVAQSYHDVTIITIGFIPDDATNILLSNLSDVAEVQSFCIYLGL